MAHPKHKTSKARKRNRRTHWKLSAPPVVNCSNCGAPKLAHHVCPECGYYANRMAVAPREDA